MTSTRQPLVRPNTLRVAIAASTALLLGTACAGANDSIGSAQAAAPTSAATSPPTTPPTMRASEPPTIEGLDVIVAEGVATLVAVVAGDDLLQVQIDWGDGTVDTADGGPVRLDHPYESSGTYVVSVAATDTTGGNAVASATASVEIEDVTPTTAPATTAPAPTTAPPAPAPTPAPAPAPAPAPTPTTTTPPTTTPPTTVPPPEPVVIDLLEQTDYAGSGTAPDGAGGSGSANQTSTNSFTIRSDAHHGYNGSGSATASLSATIDARPFLDTLPDSVIGFQVAVDWSATASGLMKHPWDRTAAIEVTSSIDVRDGAGEYVDGNEATLLSSAQSGNDDRPVTDPSANEGGTFTVNLTPETPIIEFELAGLCSSTSGPMAFALLNEGYCEYTVELTGLRATLTPIVDSAGD